MLILTTTNRLVRIVDRVREMLPEFEKLAQSEQPDQRRLTMLFEELNRATIRARVGQQALAQLLGASILLIVESRIALASAYGEMDYIHDISGHLAPVELRKRTRWRMFRWRGAESPGPARASHVVWNVPVEGVA